MELFTSRAEGGLMKTAREEEGPVPATRARTRLGGEGGAPDYHNKSDVTQPCANEKNKVGYSMSFIKQEACEQKKKIFEDGHCNCCEKSIFEKLNICCKFKWVICFNMSRIVNN